MAIRNCNMATRVATLSRSLPFRIHSLARFYGIQHKMTKDERHELAEYRRKLTEMRKEFKNEWLEQVTLSLELR